jgi:selenide,water dikinase
MEIKLTEYSHGSGCGCKISPKVLDEILSSSIPNFKDKNLIIGNDNRDDAAVIMIDDHRAIISTTDFFTPIVDNPYDFGAIAAANSISDVYAMGGKPIMAISVLGWPIEKIPSEIARRVIEGAKETCRKAGISLAGGHSIDSPEPIFGLAVTGIIEKEHIKANDGALPDCELFITKPLGIGILTTAQKKGILKSEDLEVALQIMKQLNSVGEKLGAVKAVKAMTDVTGFGLLGHMTELCEASRVKAVIQFSQVPVTDGIEYYIHQNALPGGISRNFDSYGHNISPIDEFQKSILCDPQTSGGLLIAVDPNDKNEFLDILSKYRSPAHSIGWLTTKGKYLIEVI